jgi:iron complex transport system substrate-binding protein
LEPTPLGRAEWLKFAALFFGREREAEALFAEVERGYLTLAARARAAAVKPAAFWATPTGANWSCSRNDWEAQLLADAGAANVLADRGPTRVVPLSEEFVVQTAFDADYWITLDPSDLSQGHSWKEFRSYRMGRVYDPYRRVAALGGAEWSGIAGYRPDWLLQDLVSIFHPELLPEHRAVFFQKKGGAR